MLLSVLYMSQGIHACTQSDSTTNWQQLCTNACSWKLV